MIKIQELLFNRAGGVLESSNVKLVRHKDARIDVLNKYLDKENEFKEADEPSIYEVYKNHKKAFLDYQRHQDKPIFDNCDYIVSFLGEEGTLSRFIGVYKIQSVDKSQDGIWYEIKEVDDFEDLKERIIIDWGKSTLSWHQYIENEKEIVEILPEGMGQPNFTDYTEFILNFTDLKKIIDNENHIWKRMLSSVCGVYLITDTDKGKYYVGSAYGKEGIWGRWKTYAKSEGTGHNKKLVELVNQDKNYAKNFTFTVLAILPKTITNAEAIRKENLYKEKLGTRKFGHNKN